MSNEINIQKIFKKHDVVGMTDLMIPVIKEIVEAVVDKCAEEADVENITGPNCDDHTPYRGACVSCGRYDNPDIIIGSVVDRQSILNVKQEIEYE